MIFRLLEILKLPDIADMANTSSNEVISTIKEAQYVSLQNSSTHSTQQFMVIPILLVSSLGITANTAIIIVIQCSNLKHSVFMILLRFLAVSDNLALFGSNIIQPGLFNLIFGSSVMFCRIIAFIASVFRNSLFLAHCTDINRTLYGYHIPTEGSHIFQHEKNIHCYIHLDVVDLHELSLLHFCLFCF